MTEAATTDPAAERQAHLLAYAQQLTAEMVAAEKRRSELSDKRSVAYAQLREMKVPWATIDEASGNQPGAARKALFLYRKAQEAEAAEAPAVQTADT